MLADDFPKEDKKKFGRAAAKVMKEKQDAFEREREGSRGMSNVETVLVQTCGLQAYIHKNNKT